MIGSQTMIPTL